MSDLLDLDALTEYSLAIGFPGLLDTLRPLLRNRLSPRSHGDFARWRSIVAELPGAVSDPASLRERLLGLSPWRKGPFRIGGIDIDAEWRSDLKWARLKDAVQPLAGRRILDVGCGNGYYAFRMRDAGAGVVLGLDPTILYVMQFLAVNHFERDSRILVLPLRLGELPAGTPAFDTTFSMGVLYHQRSPIEHLRQLRSTLRGGGQLVLETLYIEGDSSFARTPPGRYARMRNVWLLPSIPELTTWMRRSGYRGIEVIDRSITTTDEQRSTDWMTFESLRDALDADDPSRTVEGWPAPRRVVVTAINP